MNICIFGDSIAWGAYDAEKGGWANRVRLYIDGKDDESETYNLGISNDDTVGILRRFETEARTREAHFLIFAIGINDSYFIISKNHNRSPLERFTQNIKEIIFRSKKITDKILFVGLTPVDEARTMPTIWDADAIYRNDYVEKYNNKIKEICGNEHIDFVDIFSEMCREDYRAMLSDGLHPNTKGHEWIAQRVINILTA